MQKSLHPFKSSKAIRNSVLTFSLIILGSGPAIASGPVAYVGNYLWPDKATSQLNKLVKCHRDRVLKRSGGKEGLREALDSLIKTQEHLEDEMALEADAEECLERLANLPANENITETEYQDMVKTIKYNSSHDENTNAFKFLEAMANPVAKCKALTSTSSIALFIVGPNFGGGIGLCQSIFGDTFLVGFPSFGLTFGIGFTSNLVGGEITLKVNKNQNYIYSVYQQDGSLAFGLGIAGSAEHFSSTLKELEKKGVANQDEIAKNMLKGPAEFLFGAAENGFVNGVSAGFGVAGNIGMGVGLILPLPQYDYGLARRFLRDGY